MMKPTKSRHSKMVIQRSRKQRASFLLNEEEYQLVCFFLKKYRISNKSNWLRQTIISHILKTLDRDHPTLFNESEMR